MDLLHRFAQAPKPRWLRLILRRLVLLVLPKTVRFRGYELALHQNDHVMGSALLRGRYEAFGTRLFLEALRPGMVVVDCGANIGIYTCLASGAVGREGKVFSFEPEPENFKCLTETIRLNQLENVKAERLALSDREGEVRLFLSDINMGDHRIGESGEQRKSVSIQTTALDSYWGQHAPIIDVLKMDIQGAEGLALRGMRQTLLRSKDVKIFMEFWPQALRGCGTNPQELLDELVALGFSIQIIDQDQGAFKTVAAVSDLLNSGDAEASFDLYLHR